jgi:hypothetical protein
MTLLTRGFSETVIYRSWGLCHKRTLYAARCLMKMRPLQLRV